LKLQNILSSISPLFALKGGTEKSSHAWLPRSICFWRKWAPFIYCEVLANNIGHSKKAAGLLLGVKLCRVGPARRVLKRHPLSLQGLWHHLILPLLCHTHPAYPCLAVHVIILPLFE
jgi:hypothetical protein